MEMRYEKRVLAVCETMIRFNRCRLLDAMRGDLPSHKHRYLSPTLREVDGILRVLCREGKVRYIGRKGKKGERVYEVVRGAPVGGKGSWEKPR
jgi:hypothetical protein